MRKITSALLIVSVLSLGNVVSAAGGANDDKSYQEEYDKEIEKYTKTSEKEPSMTKYTFVGEEIIENSLVRTYLEEDSIDPIWYSIDIPEEIMEQVKSEKNGVKKINKIYEQMSKLYVENGSWLKLNVLANLTNDQYKMTNIEIGDEVKKESAKKLSIILKEIKDKDENSNISITNKENFIDNEVSELTYDFIPFNDYEQSIKVLTEKEKELKENNIITNILIGLIVLALITTVLVRKKFKKRG